MASPSSPSQTRPALEIARAVADLRAHVARWRSRGFNIGLVPTMGALHEGHLALVREARARCERVVASIFVNPAQFVAGEDLETYPRREADDIAALGALGVDLAFAPALDEIYPEGFSTAVTVSGVTEGLCGATRPGHFQGVTTVVTKLLVQCLPDLAFFGEKDYQQLQVIKRLVRDLDIPVEVVGVPTVRDEEGMALSSRNAYLSPEEREIALTLSRVLRAIAEDLSGGESSVTAALDRGLEALNAAGFDRVDYLEVRDAETLDPVATIERPARVLAAAQVGDTHLIDNFPITPPGR